jgi:hypothetical protein
MKLKDHGLNTGKGAGTVYSDERRERIRLQSKDRAQVQKHDTVTGAATRN